MVKSFYTGEPARQRRAKQPADVVVVLGKLWGRGGSERDWNALGAGYGSHRQITDGCMPEERYSK